MMPALIVVHAAATWTMVGLIWFVQLVHYPLMQEAGAEGFRRYAAEHQRRTTWIVLPTMLTELASAMWITWSRPDALSWIGLGLLGVIWSSTAWIQVPLHRRLSAGQDQQVIARLVAGNWIRTIAWTARGLLAASWLMLGR